MDAMSLEPSTIGGDRSVEELRRELAEAREQQAATSEILRVVSSAPMDLQRVFAEIAASASRLCDANDASIFQVDGDGLRLVAHHGSISAGPIGQFTLPLTRGVSAGRAVLDRRTSQVADLQAEGDEYPEGRDFALRHGFRTVLNVPLIRADAAIGVFAIRRTEARPFSDRQIELLKTFADQAVIAIENTRLFEEAQARTRELSKALEQQTATSEVLSIISKSPTETEPVFRAIVTSARVLLDGYSAALTELRGNELHLSAFTPIDEHSDAILRRAYPQLLENLPRGMHIKEAILVADIETDPRFEQWRDLARLRGYRSLLSVPLVREEMVIGFLFVSRREVGPFSPEEIALLQTFADQAVIAIENTRLFEAEQARTREVTERTRELTEALEQQTATADVLKVISRSALDLQRVLDALVESAARLTNANDALILQVFGDSLRLVAHHGQIPTARPVGQYTVHPPPCAWAHEWTCRHRPANNSGRRHAGRSGRVPRNPEACPPTRLSHRARRPFGPRRRGNRRDFNPARRSAPVHRTPDRARQHLRGPGRHRHREHTAV
jgi:two-component system, NtrC family, sensor kinase